MGHGGHLEDRPAERLEVGTRDLGQVSPVGNIDLVQDDDAGALHDRHVALDLSQFALIGGQLGLDDAQILHGLAVGLESDRVQDVHDDGAALNVTQEIQAQASSLGRAGNQAGDVGDRVARIPRRHDAKIRHEGRKTDNQRSSGAPN